MNALLKNFGPATLELLKRRRVLVVDDQWTNIQRVGSLLGELGVEIIPALNGKEALDRAATCAPDLLLLDFIMPGMDGCEVCRRLRETVDGREIPVIFLSAADDKDLVVRALAAGGMDYITKPFNSAELLSRVRTQLALKSARDELRQLAEEKDELLGMLTHDLKSLLGGINLSAGLAHDRLATGGETAVANLAGDIAEGSARLLSFVKQFLSNAAADHESVGNPGVAAPVGRILVTDDQPENIQLVGAMLGRLGHEIIPATDGATALKRMELKAPDLVLLDLLMPRMDGFETCRRLRAAAGGKDLPVIFLSSAGDKDFIVRGLRAGAVDYVTKPFHQAELVLRVQTQLALKFTRDRLAQLASDREQLAGLLADDFKNQLETTLGQARSLNHQTEGRPDERVAQLASNIARSSAQLVEFVTGFLNAAGKKLALHPVPLSFCNAVKGTVKRYLESAREKEVRLVVDPPPMENDLVLADELAVDRVLDNLVSNALKFSPRQTTVRLSVQSTACQVQCRIADQGPGFTPEDKTRMFRRFGRLSARPTGGEGSTGLGLSIVRKLTRAMDGEVTCQSVPGQGSVFTVGLPRLGLDCNQT
ncbi:MAG TPA: response regulator [Verrucomicrobiae bacterium]|nr:response regulator [Verrucomicrobiae bacterium]